MLRQKVTTDIATKGGQFDVLTIGTYEVPIWAKQGWLVPLDNLGADYDVDDLLPAIRERPVARRQALCRAVLRRKLDGHVPQGPVREGRPQHAGRADLGLHRRRGQKITDKAKEVYGICLRGKAGWGENMAFLTAMSNSFGARWFDEKWKPQFDQPEWKDTLDFYVNLMKDAGPPGASSNGFNENLALFNAGKCGMWIDATVAASFVTNPKESKVADKVGFALAPDNGLGKRGNWLWAWSLAVPAGSQKAEAAQKFVAWATSKDYTELVAAKEGWANVPPGTRTSLYNESGVPEGGALREDDARLDQLGRSDQADRQAGALCRRAVRGDPGVPGPRHDGRPALLGGACRRSYRSTQALAERTAADRRAR